ncbi:MAG: vanadium-dependent haloperoxidase [Pyrinomonadaceae bacterium]
MRKTAKAARGPATDKKQPPATTTREKQADSVPAPPANGEVARADVSRSRRSFLGKVTVAAAAASVLGIPKLIKSQQQVIDDTGSGGGVPPSSCGAGCDIEIQTPAQRANTSLAKRVEAAILERQQGIPPHPCNGDEVLYQNQYYIGSFTKGLAKINNLGEVDPAAYCALLKAVQTASPADFNAIPLGCVPCSSNGGSFQLDSTTYDSAYYSSESAVPDAQAEADASTQSELSASEQASTYDGPVQTEAQNSADQQAAANAKAQYVPQEETARLSAIGTLASGLQRRLVNPQSGVAYDLEGIDSHQLAANAAPAFASADDAAEEVELYWMSLARDVPFIQYSSNSTIGSAVTDLNTRYKWYAGLPQYEVVPPGRTPRLQPRGFPTYPMTPLGQIPGANNNITRDTIFRGFTKGDLTGPYLSQFLIRDIPYGAQTIFNTLQPLAAQNYMTNQDSWFFVQKGCMPSPPAMLQLRRRIVNARDLASYVHIDAITQAYWNALWFILMVPDATRLDGGGLGIPFDPNNPYNGNCTQEGFVTFGPTHITALLNKVAYAAHKHAWYEKWFVHRRLRPEEYGGRVNFTLKNIKQYPINSVINNSTALPLIAQQTGGNYFLPQAYPEGSPVHPSYIAGHATLAGAAATILKAFFNDQAIIPTPVYQTDANGNLVTYTGPGYNQLTVGGELDKLASNIALGRDWAGVHWRSDYTASMLRGEDVAVTLLTDYGFNYNEPFAGFSFTDFRGRRRTGIGRKR